MSFQLNNDQISIADQLLKQLEDEYFAIQNQNLPKQNNQVQDDPDNPYQPLQFPDQESQDQQQYYNQNSQQQVKNEQKQSDINENEQKNEYVQQIQQNQFKIQILSNPQKKDQLIEVSPTDQMIFSNIPHQQFEIDEQKIKKYSLQFDIQEPEWMNNDEICKKRVQQLFFKTKNKKPFVKI